MQGLNNTLSTGNWTVADSTQQPTDTVSSICWGEGSPDPIFAAGSWDSHVRIYLIDPNKKDLIHMACLETDSPCLSLEWPTYGSKIFAGCASGKIKALDATKGSGIDIGNHPKPVKDLHWMAEMNLLCSVSFDKTVKFWDVRQTEPVYQCELGYKPMSSDLHENKLAIALSGFKVTVIDLAEALKAQSSQESFQYLDSPLGIGDPLSAIKFLPNGERLAFGTAGGRCNISKIINDGSKMVQFSSVMKWKAHKVDAARLHEQVAYPVNCFLVNSKKPSRFLGSCGGEGKIRLWDFEKFNKIRELQMKDSVTCGKMSPDGNWLAFATGYDWSRGISGYKTKNSEVCVRPVQEEDLFYESGR